MLFPYPLGTNHGKKKMPFGYSVVTVTAQVVV